MPAYFHLLLASFHFESTILERTGDATSFIRMFARTPVFHDVLNVASIQSEALNVVESNDST